MVDEVIVIPLGLPELIILAELIVYIGIGLRCVHASVKVMSDKPEAVRVCFNKRVNVRADDMLSVSHYLGTGEYRSVITKSLFKSLIDGNVSLPVSTVIFVFRRTKVERNLVSVLALLVLADTLKLGFVGYGEIVNRDSGFLEQLYRLNAEIGKLIIHIFAVFVLGKSIICMTFIVLFGQCYEINVSVVLTPACNYYNRVNTTLDSCIVICLVCGIIGVLPYPAVSPYLVKISES